MAVERAVVATEAVAGREAVVTAVEVEVWVAPAVAAASAAAGSAAGWGGRGHTAVV